ncbi:MAG: 30S ribosomal protein S9 [Candidatus Micrarchaeia archaeon]
MAKRKTTKTAEAADVEKIESSEKVEKEALEQKEEEKESKQESKVKKRSSKKQIVVSARRKMAIARSSIKPGKGIVRINKINLNAIDNPYVKTLISEPLKIANDYVSQVDIDVDVYGGGQMGQAQAVRSAIAKALVAYTKDSQLKKDMLAYDRFMLVDDVRQVEPKKFKGRKARARFQKSYR